MARNRSRVLCSMGQDGHPCGAKPPKLALVFTPGNPVGTEVGPIKTDETRNIERIIFNTKPLLLTSIRRGQYERYKYRRQEAANKIEFNQKDYPAAAHSEWIDWRVIATWIDGEGNLSTRERPRNNRDYLPRRIAKGEGSA